MKVAGLVAGAVSILIPPVADSFLSPMEAKLLPTDGRPSDFFGYSTAIDRDRAVVGAIHGGDEAAGFGPGAAYIFFLDSTGWMQEAKLATGDLDFGRSVAISGSTVVVGSPYGPGGKVYVFVRQGSSWLLEEVLVGPDNSFGWSVAIDGDTIIVGAPHTSNVAGSAFIYVRSGASWSQAASLAESPASWSGFGKAVALRGGLAVVGAPGLGRAYVYSNSVQGWQLEATLSAPPGAPGAFGESVAVDGNLVAVGAVVLSFEGSQDAAYAFRAPMWEVPLRLLPLDAGHDAFGYSLAIRENVVMVGAPWTPPAQPMGAVYAFTCHLLACVNDDVLQPADISAFDAFGLSVGFDGDRVMVGSYGDGDQGPDSGSAYVFHWTPL